MPGPRLTKSTLPDKANQGAADAPGTRGTDGQSWATSPATRKAMQANRRRDTAPEMAIRRPVHARGLRYRVDARPLPKARHTADMIFTRAGGRVHRRMLVARLHRALPAGRQQHHLLVRKGRPQPRT
jgi:hypothetical protein